MKNRTWVLDQCVKKVPADADSCFRLLEYGLKLTENAHEESERVAAAVLRSARAQLVHFMDMLNDYEASCC